MEIDNINLNLYKIFYVVANSKSYTEASEKLYITKTAISKDIMKLESLLDTQLFYREKNGVRLTEEGNELYEYVSKGLGLLSAGTKIIYQKNDFAKGKINIGSYSHISACYLMDRIEKAKKEYPDLNIKVNSKVDSQELIELLEEHKVDIAIDCGDPNFENKSIQIEKLKEIDNIFISNIPLKIKSKKELENLKYILGLEYTYATRNLMKFMKENGISIKPYMEIHTTELKIDAAKRGLGIAHVMRDTVKKELENKELFEVEIPLKLPITEINLLYIKGQLTKSSKEFIKKYLKK